jgi:hypothetical protein
MAITGLGISFAESIIRSLPQDAMKEEKDRHINIKNNALYLIKKNMAITYIS